MIESSTTVRAFLALPVPAEVIAKLIALQKTLSELLPDVAWTRPESLHLTIQFLGNVRAAQLEALRKTIGLWRGVVCGIRITAWAVGESRKDSFS